ncbi:MAG TPA: 16S rRNA (guanine(966)-N(2))-methyltransferase RsmD [Polyangiaceae bacterium]|nr:16S rRNA (guanine(966)-N(2))-methyltransferase RsmD [Polyangiaceae bacterium]
MRVIAGVLKGRRLAAPRGDATRPTSDRVREAVFGILGDVSGARVLDSFAGSGAMGIEALSRGAEGALFVERRRAAVDVIRRNVTELGLADRAQLFAGPVARSGAVLVDEGPFDLVFADPPYDFIVSGRLDVELRAAVKKHRWWSAGATFVLEHRSKDPPPSLAEALGVELDETRRYGGTSVTFYRWT